MAAAHEKARPAWQRKAGSGCPISHPRATSHTGERNNPMYVQKGKNGKFQAVQTYKDPLSEKTKKVTVTLEKNTSRTRNEAMRILQKKIDGIIEEAGTVKTRLTFDGLVSKYLAGIKGTHKASTVDRNGFALNTWLDLIGRDTLVSKLPELDILSLLDKTGKDAKWKNGKLERFKACVNWGYQHRHIDSAEWLRRLPPYKTTPHKVEIWEKYLEVKEYHELLRDTQEYPVWNLLIQIMVLSGMRFGEAAALHKEDVDIDGGLIHIRRSYDSRHGKETSVKSQTSARDIFIQPQLAEALRQMQTQMRIQQMRTKVASKYFMSGEDGEPVHYWAFNKFLKCHTDRVCGRQLTTHALRHTSASVMFAQGFTLDEIARRLGHDGSRITEEIYVHITKEVRERDQRKISSFVV